MQLQAIPRESPPDMNREHRMMRRDSHCLDSYLFQQHWLFYVDFIEKEEEFLDAFGFHLASYGSITCAAGIVDDEMAQ